MRGISICTGIGGLDLAAEMAGVTVVGQVEIDPDCHTVLRHQFPGVPLLPDLRKVRGDEFGPFDLLFGGIPCQPFSQAGKKLGEHDERDLWDETFRIVRDQQPHWLLIENVARFAHAALDRVAADLEKADYAWWATVLPACAIGSPQRRERTFIVAHANHSGDEEQQDHLSPQPGLLLTGEGTARRDERRESAAVDRAGVDRTVDGIIGRLDATAWPARRGALQEHWERPRTRGHSVRYDKKRLRMIGNMAIPQMAYPFFALIVAADEGERVPCSC